MIAAPPRRRTLDADRPFPAAPRPRATALALPRYRLVRLRAIAGLGIAIAALLAMSLLSMEVATMRARVDAIDRRLATARRVNATLTTEFDIRSRPGALLAWGDAALALAPPRVHQYLAGIAELQALGRPMPPAHEIAMR